MRLRGRNWPHQNERETDLASDGAEGCRVSGSVQHRTGANTEERRATTLARATSQRRSSVWLSFRSLGEYAIARTHTYRGNEPVDRLRKRNNERYSLATIGNDAARFLG